LRLLRIQPGLLPDREIHSLRRKDGFFGLGFEKGQLGKKIKGVMIFFEREKKE